MPITPFTRLTSPAAPLVENDIDTDAILPARFLLAIDRRQIAEGLFHDRRFGRDGTPRPDGTPDPDFVLNREPFRAAQILVAGANFGCGSSREHAPWALVDNGIRCVIARGFGEIFRANCLRNGLLPVALDGTAHNALSSYAASGRPITVDLESCTIAADGLAPIAFSIDPGARTALLKGWDETAAILELYGTAIAAFEEQQAGRMPWLYDEQWLAGALDRARMAVTPASGPTPHP